MFEILVIDDNPSICEILQEALTDKGYKLDTAINALAGIDFLKKKEYHIVITDLKMEGASGIDILKLAKQINSEIEVIIITAYGTIDSAIEAMRCGAVDFILKPFQIEEMENKIENIVSRLKLKLNNTYLLDELREIYGQKIIGNSKPVRKMLEDIKRVASVNSNVLILGETGTGKELVARAVHYSSARKDNAFVKVNCAALPFDLLESELFGHEKGAFTSAYNRRIGRFELADKGTLFIDEVSEIPLATQVKLLRVLQEREFERLGSSETLKSDVRIISATNKNLESLVETGKFRKDLFYRLNVFPVFAPPLRERREDIPELVHYFVDKYSKLTGKQINKIENDVFNILNDYDWPGNIRELENIIERMIVVSDEDCIIKAACIPQEIRRQQFTVNLSAFNTEINAKAAKLPELLANIEMNIISEHFRKNKFNQTKTAEKLGISRTDLQYKIKKYNIEK